MREAGNDDLGACSCHDGDTEERSVGVGVQPVGVLMHVGPTNLVGSYKYGAFFLRPNIVVDADHHHMVYENRGSAIRRGIRNQVFQLLAQTEPRVPRSFAKGLGA